MTRRPVLQRLTSLGRAGVLADFSPSEAPPSFARFNLIYGFNGSGKTTLSRLFSSLAASDLSEHLPPDCAFRFGLSDGNTITSTGFGETLGARVHAFNQEYVETNFVWKEGRAKPIFFVAGDHANATREIDALNAALQPQQEKLVALRNSHSSASETLSDLKKTTAQLVSSTLRLSTRYEAPQLDKDYRTFSRAPDHLLSEDELRAHRGLLMDDEPPEKLPPTDGRFESIAGVVSDTRVAASLSLGTLAISELNKHATMMGWIDTGLRYHQSEELSTCLFCANKLEKDRLRQLEEAISGSYQNLISQLNDVGDQVASTLSGLNALIEALPPRSAYARPLQPRAGETMSALESLLLDSQRWLNACRVALDEKRKAPDAESNYELPADSLIRSHDERVSHHLAAIHHLIDEHNELVEEFEARRKKARAALRDHYLEQYADRIEKRTEQCGDLAAQVGEVESDVNRLERQIADAQVRLRSHAPGAEAISGALERYLGHGEITLRAKEEGYELLRHGDPITGSLSEGEKTALALSYFVCSLSASDQGVNDLIVVIDDPVSSLDSRALNYALNLIRTTCASAAQVFLLTHNLHFMNEAKKWLRTKNKPDREPKSAFYFLETSVDEVETRRSSKMIRMPKLLLDYDSEYHYLFSLVLEAASVSESNSRIPYLMPNVIRKVLEVFFAYHYPEQATLSSKIGRTATEHPELDEVQVRAVNRLVQLESHGDSLDDLVSFSSVTVEETRDAAVATLDIIASIDEGHFNQVKTICERAQAT